MCSSDLHSLPGLKIGVLDCQGDEEKMNKMKNEQRERKKAEGDHVVYRQQSDDSSVSSSDEEDLNDAVARENGETRPGRKEKLRQQWASKQEKALPHHGEKHHETSGTQANQDGILASAQDADARLAPSSEKQN